MQKIKFLLSLTLSVFVCTTFPLSAELGDANGASLSRGFSRIAKKAMPAVVFIESQVTKDNSAAVKKKQNPSENPFDYFNDDFLNHFFGFPRDDKPKKPETVRGSGFVVSQDGYIVTNNHVVENATKITVTFYGGRKIIATVIGTDPKTDLAVIKIDEKNLPTIAFGNSDSLEVGDWAIAVGNPFGLEATVTVGVVSAKGRNQLHITDFEDFIQTDAAINPGNSGGPLLNVDGEVIGINTAIVSGSGGYMGIGFAIPSNMATRIIDQLVKSGSVTRGFLGVTMQPIDEELARYYKLDRVTGALVADIVKGSPADAAGLKQEDIILSYNSLPVDNLSGFRNAVAMMTPGTQLNLKVFRDGKIKDIKVTIAKQPVDGVVLNATTEKLGMQVQNLTPELAAKFGYTDEKGVIVTRVNEGSAAALASIRPGSLILAVNRKNVEDVAQFTKAVEESAKDDTVLLLVRQGEATRFIALRIE
jgi:serine protease Do